MPVPHSDVTIGDVNKLLELMHYRDITTQALSLLLEADGSAASLAELLTQATMYPFKWAKRKHFAFRFDGRSRIPLPAAVAGTELSFMICGECREHIRLELDGRVLFIGLSSDDFIQLTPFLQVRPDPTGLFVRIPFTH